MNVIQYRRSVLPADAEAVQIGTLYKKAKVSFVESVRALDKVGQKLIEKKASCAHGEWQIWLGANTEALGFGERTARLLMKGHTKLKEKLTSDLTEAEALELNRLFWGNNTKHGTNRITAQPVTAITESLPRSDFQKQLIRLQQAWSAASPQAREEFLVLVTAENAL
jgi:hypothetical protein